MVTLPKHQYLVRLSIIEMPGTRIYLLCSERCQIEANITAEQRLE